jgi:hypothetical protein
MPVAFSCRAYSIRPFGVDAGFGARVMFGSDQMVWPEALETAIQAVEQTTFLSADQKRDIFYNNAARFLKLTNAEMSRHKALTPP